MRKSIYRAIAAMLSCMLMLSAGALNVSAKPTYGETEQDEQKQYVYSDNFDDYTMVPVNTEGEVGDSGWILNYDSANGLGPGVNASGGPEIGASANSSTVSVGIGTMNGIDATAEGKEWNTNGVLQFNTKWGRKPSYLELKPEIIAPLTGDRDISFKMGYGYYETYSSSDGSGGIQAGNVAARFMVNGDSYYEIGISSGSSTSQTQHLFIPTEWNDNTYLDYVSRVYFRKVIDGNAVAESLVWEDGEDSLYQQMQNSKYGDKRYERKNAYAYCYNGHIPQFDIQIRGNEISWTVSGVYQRSANERYEYSWSDSYIDSEPLNASGSGFGFISGKWEKGAVIDDVMISSNQYNLAATGKLYWDAAYGKRVSSGLVDLGEATVVKGVSVPGLTGSNDVSLSTDGTEYTSVTLDFDGSGTALMDDNRTAYRFVRINGASSILVLSDISGAIPITVPGSVKLCAVYSDTPELNDIVWESSYSGVRVSDGLVTADSEPLDKVVITAEHSGCVLQATFEVSGGYEHAVATGNASAYMSERKYIVDYLNSAIERSDTDTIDAMLTQGGDNSLRLIKAVDVSLASNLKNSDALAYADFLAEFAAQGPFEFTTLSHMYALRDAVKRAYDEVVGDATDKAYFYDNFTSYNSGNAQFSDVHAEKSNPKVIADGGDYRWVLSGSKYGVNDSSGETGYARISGSSLAVGDLWVRGTAVNLEHDNFTIGEAIVYRAKVRTSGHAFGLRILVDSDENTYYEFGISRSDTKPSGVDRTPYVFDKYTGKNYVPDSAWSLSGNFDIEISIMNDEIAWNIYQDNKTFARTLPLTAKAIENTKYLCAAVTYGDGYSYLNELEISSGAPYVGIGEPSNILYTAITDGVNISNNVITFENPQVIRRLICPAIGGKTARIDLSKDGTTYKSYTNEFDVNGNWVNIKTAAPLKAIRLTSGTDLSGSTLLTDVKSTDILSVVCFDTLKLYATAGGVWNNPNVTWSVDNEKIASVDGGTVYGKKDGIVTVTAKTPGGTLLSAKVHVKDEMTVAEEEGKLEQYLTAKKPIIDKLNGLLEANDTTGLANFLTSEEVTDLAGITYIDTEKIAELKAEKPTGFEAFLKRLCTYQSFPFTSKADITALQRTLDIEIAMDKICSVADITAMEENLTETREILDFPLDNIYYLDAKEAVLEKMLNTAFENYGAALKRFTDSYVMLNIQSSNNNSYIGKLVSDCADEIGYDHVKFKSNMSDTGYLRALGDGIRTNKGSFDTLEKLSSYIDDFKYESNKGNTTGGSPGGGGSSGGSGGGNGFISGGIFGGGGGVVFPLQEQPDNLGTSTVPPVSLYSDVPIEHWSYEGIRFLTARRAINGYEDGSFRPNDEVTRSEFLKMLMASLQIEAAVESEKTEDESTENAEATGDNTEETVFADVATDEWYYPYVKEAKKAGITNGDGNGYFNPDARISREEMAAMVIRALELKGLTLPRTEVSVFFDDYDVISDWAFASVTQLQLAGILDGRENGCFAPQGTATRAEVAKVIYLTAMKGVSAQ